VTRSDAAEPGRPTAARWHLGDGGGVAAAQVGERRQRRVARRSGEK
jgi:hypothetical protein